MYYLLALVVVLVLGSLLLSWWLRLPLPQLDGELWVDGLTEPVIVERDRFGVPHIKATSVTDAVFANGFVHAQDRLWQMELNRRLGAGRLSELLGEEALAADQFIRRLGLRRAAQSDLEALTEKERAFIGAYCAGVNAGVASLGRRLPLEFRLLRVKPQAWTPLDSLSWVQVMSMDLCANWEQELIRGKILDKLGAQGASLLHLLTDEAALTLPPGTRAGPVLESLSSLYEKARGYMPNGGFPGASNGWVVGGQRSASGQPLLANDPHLVGRAPAVWYELRVEAPGLDVQGAGFPGLPLVVVGHNKDLAWGITNSFADTQDLFFERFDPERPDFYETEDGWEQAQVLEESIRVKGGETVVERITVTRHGPVLTREGDMGLALGWVNFEPSNPFQTILAMNSAQSAEQFREALRTWQAPSSNFVFADTQGNIGYLMAGDIPIRRNGSGLVPVPGWSGEYEWEGRIPFEELPQIMNPESGFVVTANNPVVGHDFKHHITWDWMGPWRAQRIEDLILAEEHHTADSFLKIQLDMHSHMGPRFARTCERLEPVTAIQTRALELLLEWDGEGGSESQAMCLYQVMMLSSMRLILEPLLGETLCAEFLGESQNPVAVMAGHTGRYTTWLIQLLEQPERFKALEHPQGLDVILAQALEQSVAFLEQRLGSHPDAWRWGKLHRLQFKHPMGINRILGSLFNGPLVGVGGDTDTVFQTAVVPHEPYGAEAWCPSFRQVVDLADPNGARSILPTGQSGHPMSPNYMDQFSMWLTGESRSHRERAVTTLALTPTARR